MQYNLIRSSPIKNKEIFSLTQDKSRNEKTILYPSSVKSIKIG